MNLLRKGSVVGVLVVIALVLLFHNGIMPWFRGDKPEAAALGLAPAQATLPPNPAAHPAADHRDAHPTNPVSTAIDLKAVQADVDRWRQAPRRDPFGTAAESQLHAAQRLTLSAIWRQTDASLAVINDAVVTEGARILDFNVEKIEEDRVWVTGPNGREELNFRHPGRTPPAPLQAESTR